MKRFLYFLAIFIVGSLILMWIFGELNISLPNKLKEVLFSRSYSLRIVSSNISDCYKKPLEFNSRFSKYDILQESNKYAPTYVPSFDEDDLVYSLDFSGNSIKKACLKLEVGSQFNKYKFCEVCENKSSGKLICDFKEECRNMCDNLWDSLQKYYSNKKDCYRDCIAPPFEFGDINGDFYPQKTNPIFTADLNPSCLFLEMEIESKSSKSFKIVIENGGIVKHNGDQIAPFKEGLFRDPLYFEMYPGSKNRFVLSFYSVDKSENPILFIKTLYDYKYESTGSSDILTAFKIRGTEKEHRFELNKELWNE